MLEPHTAAELNIDDIKAMCDELIEAHGELYGCVCMNKKIEYDKKEGSVALIWCGRPCLRQAGIQSPIH